MSDYTPISAGNHQLKQGAITAQILQHVKMNGPCSYTELNKLYKEIQYGYPVNYDSVRDRGGSYPHHHASLTTPRKRKYSGKIEMLIKEPGRNGKYHFCNNMKYMTYITTTNRMSRSGWQTKYIDISNASKMEFLIDTQAI
jgi:hypothetical protein